MTALSRSAALCGWAAALAMIAIPAASAATGDTLRVVGERVNLRAGPSDDANVRSQILQGEQVLELRRDGNWYGVRVLRTGEEGWMFGNLLEPLTPTTLGAEAVQLPSAGFRELAPDFDRLLGNLAQRYGFPLFESVRPEGSNGLRVTLSPQWLRAGSADEHLLAATAVYEMWKNHQNGAPVLVELLEPGGKRYLTIDDAQKNGALLTVSAD
ncbi:MAG: SH3 domain-containing protein [Geminicoccaceae bacterium]